MPINPIDIIDRGPFRVDLSIPDVGSIITRYPRNLGNDEENKPAMMFKFHNADASKLDPQHERLKGLEKYLALPIPAELPFADTYSYKDSSLESYWTWVKNMISRAGENLGSIAGGDPTDLGNRKKGIEKNNQAALTFENPNFRNFVFSWDLVAYDKVDLAAILSIIYKFRIGAASHFEKNNTFSDHLEYPSLVSFIIYPGGNTTPFPASYPCFIESVSYVPLSSDGQIVFSKNYEPIGYKLTITLKESMYLDREEIRPGLDFDQGF